MDWFTVKGSLRDHPKWTSLSPVGRGAWITLMTIGHGQPGGMRWTLGPYPHVMELLRREGFDDPGRAMAELGARRLIDVSDKGVVSMHDASKHQKFPSDLPSRVTARSAKSKAKAKEKALVQEEWQGTAGNGEERPGTDGNDDRQTGETGETDRQTVVPLHRPTNLRLAARLITSRDPTDKEAEWIDDLCGSYGREHISRALWEVRGARTVKHLLSRVSHHFRDGTPLNGQEAAR